MLFFLSCSFRSVYRAKGQNDYPVVIKIAGDRDQRNNYRALNREIRSMRHLEHENILSLMDIATATGLDGCLNRALVLEECICDLKTLMYGGIRPHIKSIIKDVLTGLSYLEGCQILHCDLKPENLLLSFEGQMKICDFGFAMPVNSHCPHKGWTYGYCSPEALLGSRALDVTTDSWGAGCILAELYMEKNLFQVATGIEQMTCIFQLCGTYTADEWKSLLPVLKGNRHKRYMPVNRKCSRVLKHRLSLYTEDPNAIDIVEQLLIMDPWKRITSANALQLPYFSENHCSSLPDLVIEKLENKSPGRGV